MLNFYERTCINEYSVRLRPQMHVNYYKELSVNIAKTELMTIGSRQRIGVTHDDIAGDNIKLGGSKINKVETVKSLGVHIDKHFSWSVHIEKITKKIASAMGALIHIRPFITTKTAVQVYQALMQPHFDYRCLV